MSRSYAPSDILLGMSKEIYHLGITRNDLAPDILIVGDPGRAKNIGAEFFDDIAVSHEHRGLATVTGTSAVTSKAATIISPLPTTVTTSGMGTPSLEIVVNELVLLNEVDIESRTRKEHYDPLHIIRVGTSGGLQDSTKLGTPIISTYAIGMDNTGLFYEAPYADEHCARMEEELHQFIAQAMDPKSRFHGKIHPYVSKADPEIAQALHDSAKELGIEVKYGMTASNSGLFAPQGRDVSRISPSVPDIDLVLSQYQPNVDGQLVENMEMESSFLFHFLTGHGYRSGSICPAIANRRKNTFDPNYKEGVSNATKIALSALRTLREA